jgi:hypothetical protein
MGARVTRLDEYSPIGRWFTLGSFLKNPNSIPHLLPTFFTVKDMH